MFRNLKITFEIIFWKVKKEWRFDLFLTFWSAFNFLISKFQKYPLCSSNLICIRLQSSLSAPPSHTQLHRSCTYDFASVIFCIKIDFLHLIFCYFSSDFVANDFDFAYDFLCIVVSCIKNDFAANRFCIKIDFCIWFSAIFHLILQLIDFDFASDFLCSCFLHQIDFCICYVRTQS